MIGTSTLLASLLALINAPDVSGVSAAEFQSWFNAANAKTLTVPAEVEQNARAFRYVFVAGFGNEQMPGYFVQNAKELRARGVPRKSIHYIDPSSHATIEDNARKVRDQFLAIAEKGPERLVIVAHSRGACDALAFALSEPDFVRDRVEALFLLQGPFGGTALADYVKGHGPSMDNRMPFRFRITAGLIGRFERVVLRRGGHGGLADLTREESRRFWTKMLEVHAYAIPVVSPKTYFLRSECPPSSLGRFLRSIAWYLKTYDGPNDGVVAVRDQYLPDFGTSLGIVECGHGDLTRRVSTRGSRHLREAVMRSIVMAVGRG